MSSSDARRQRRMLARGKFLAAYLGTVRWDGEHVTREHVLNLPVLMQGRIRQVKIYATKTGPTAIGEVKAAQLHGDRSVRVWLDVYPTEKDSIEASVYAVVHA